MPDRTIDILLAVYNGERYLPEQLDSILKQSYLNIRVIIRDNSSSDATPSLLKEYQKRHPGKIVCELSDENVGVIGNFSKLMETSRSAYAMFSDHDDVWLPNKVADTMAKMRSMEARYGKETPILVHADLFVVDKSLRVISPSFWRYAHLSPERTATLGQLVMQNVVTGCTMMANRALLNLAIPVPCEQVVMHDWWLALVAAAFGHIGTVPHPLILYRQHGKNTLGAQKFSVCRKLRQAFTEDGNRKKKWIEQASAFYKRYEKRLSAKQKKVLERFIHLENSFLFQRAYAMLRHGLYKQGLSRNAGFLLLGK